ncbi:hypothetical protein [Methylocystis echinoides]|uniref:hypothetical protein n=1 Tax=Methylocystis echinoides TaxID=29468 RepID=UPI002491476A|nr:hypothetical protein [Methylocystis echinoides]
MFALPATVWMMRAGGELLVDPCFREGGRLDRWFRSGTVYLCATAMLTPAREPDGLFLRLDQLAQAPLRAQ